MGKLWISRIGKSDIFPFIITSLLHCSTLPPGPIPSTVSAAHTLQQLLPLISANAGNSLRWERKTECQLRNQDKYILELSLVSLQQP